MSVAANYTTATRQPHVPAWKRIGLKLKYAKDYSGDQSPQQDRVETIQPEITGAWNEDQEKAQRPAEDVRPAKKRRTSPERQPRTRDSKSNALAAVDSAKSTKRQAATARHPAVVSTEHDDGGSNHELETSNYERTNSRSRSTSGDGGVLTIKPRKKSVTFTPETKPDDYSSVLTPAEHETTSQQPVVPDPGFTQHSTSTSKQSEKENKRTKPKRAVAESGSGHSSAKQIANGATKEVPVYVQYLEIFYTDKPSWKFSKNSQKDLLKNIFNIHRVPLQHHAAILQYISGLQGVSARQRLVESAQAILKAIADKEDDIDLEVMESEEARRTAYAAALKRQIEWYERSGSVGSEYDGAQLVEMKDELERGQRAEAILGQLLQQEMYPTQHSIAQQATPPAIHAKAGTEAASTGGNTSTPDSKKRKRKSRTQVLSEESASSSENEGDFHPSRGPATMHDALSARSDPKPKVQQGKSSSPSSEAKVSSKIIFDDDLLDRIFPKPKKHREPSPKRKSDKGAKGRNFAYTHGMRADESESDSA